MATMDELAIETPRGEARAHVGHPARRDRREPPGALVLSHGAGGGVNAPDIQAATSAALSVGFAVALVEQPYRVAGRRGPAPAGHLDEAWCAVIERLGEGALAGMALVTGGRSLGARVACRTAAATGAVGVLCLAFPLAPPSRRGGATPAASRLPELDAVTVPTLVIQGRSDRFGMPPDGPNRAVVQVDGDHGLKRDLPAVRAATAEWLAGRG